MFSEKIENVYIFLIQKPEYLIIIFQTVFRFLPGSFLCRQSENASRTISRVLSGMIICLGRLLPAASSDLPKASGPHHCFCSVLLRMGFTYALSVTRKAVVSYTALPPLPVRITRNRRYISVALSWESPPPDVIRHPAL